MSGPKVQDGGPVAEIPATPNRIKDEGCYSPMQLESPVYTPGARHVDLDDYSPVPRSSQDIGVEAAEDPFSINKTSKESGGAASQQYQASQKARSLLYHVAPAT